MPFSLHRTKIKIVDTDIIDVGKHILLLKDGRKIRSFRIAGYHTDIVKSSPLLKENTILEVYCVDCKSDHIGVVGELNEEEGFYLEQITPTSNYMRNIEIEFPNERGELEFQNAACIFTKLGAMPYQSDYKSLENLISDYNKEHLNRLLCSCKISQRAVEGCRPDEFAQFVYYILHRLYHEKRLKDSLPDNPDDLLYEVISDAIDCLGEMLKTDSFLCGNSHLIQEIARGFKRRFMHLIYEMKGKCPIILPEEKNIKNNI